MKQVLLRKGRAVVEEVPPPALRDGAMLVRVVSSAVSSGTEKFLMSLTGKPLYRRALEKPELVRQTLKLAATRGISRTVRQVRGKLDTAQPAGYSAAGVVLQVGAGVSGFAPGDRVACAGAGWANHAELICVPVNLAVKLPGAVSFNHGATVALGAIALQGVRRAAPTMGEQFLVMGLGLLGQLTVQLLQAGGVRVIGLDPDAERSALALSLGMERAVGAGEEDPVEATWRATGGLGADGVLITAASPSSELISRAFRACRRKGRVVLVGDVGLELKREELYEKELDFFISTSYGPGRYDPRYELEGADYPAAYVRWTENRNMGAYLQLLQEQKVNLEPLISATFPVEEAPRAFALLNDAAARPLAVILEYPQPPGRDADSFETRLELKPPAQRRGRLGLALVGAGQFAVQMHLPNAARLKELLELRAVVDPDGRQAAEIARQFGAAYATSALDDVLGDPGVEGVLITTRHHLHAPLALQALRAGKHVLVEKPLAIHREELAQIQAFYGDGGAEKPLLLTGFNRRFSPYLRRIRELTATRDSPLVINYQVNAGFLPPEHWVHGPEGGGRNLGEACHFYDLFVFLAGAPVVKVAAAAADPPGGRYRRNDNFSATVTFADGTLAVLTYTALGHQDYPKERMEICWDGKVLALDDFNSLQLHGIKAAGLRTREQQKGHPEELKAWTETILAGGPWPIPLAEQLAVTEIAFAVEEQLC